MPCDTIQTSQVDLSSLGKISPDLLLAALNDLKLGAVRRSAERIEFGYGESFDITTGQMRLASNHDINEIKRAYSRQVVKSQAAKAGWLLKEIKPGQFQAIKR